MQIKIGGVYLTRDGHKATIDCVSTIEGWKWSGHYEGEPTEYRDWLEDGSYWQGPMEVGEDLVSLVSDPPSSIVMDARATMAMHLMPHLLNMNPSWTWNQIAEGAVIGAEALIAALSKPKEE